ncbi:DNA damage checkpoint protein rad25 [Tritrichomonas foetus]|uniref:DNA damage checkpoint protein rad25 n=1 Tax=Tritrichomonas foetus TaxID=1144522 RepID=A0A1J4JLI9_9EUKA|nr:DNA damage checkpoint protein rad25 [Tritrichomonas foetus]|eukprot:OHS98413.1 DNA damage checkpoint protein rad25 [Tritrichomonas foetus]
MTINREDVVYMAMTAKTLADFPKMIACIHEFASLDPKLDYNEQQLVSFAFKGALNLRRRAFRYLKSIIIHENSKDNTERVKQLNLLNNQILKELHEISHDIINLIDTKLLVASEDPFNKLFYYIIKGDFYRYMVECPLDESSVDEFTNKSRENYLAALEIVNNLPSEKKLTSRALILSLHYGIFLCHVEGNKKDAIAMVNKVITENEENIEKMENDNDEYSDAMTVLHLMRDHVEIWENDGALNSLE